MAFKNKDELIQYVKQQSGTTLLNDKTDILNNKRYILHTDIKREDKNDILSLFIQRGIRYEQHLIDSYFIFLR
jgi:hypothetical protein